MEEKPEIDWNAVALSLCNFNSFGIGYLLAGLKKRWLIALGGNLALLIIGHFANASKSPALWAAIFLLAFAGMTVDLWLLIRKDAGLIPAKLTGKNFMLPLIAAGIFVVFFGGFFSYRAAGNVLLTKGRAAYDKGDESLAFKDLYSANQLYRLSLNKKIVEEKSLLDEVSMIVAGKSFAAEKKYAEALDAVNKFHEFYPASPKISEMNNLAIDTNLAWARDFQSTADYQGCLEHFQTAMKNYPEEAAARKDEIDAAMADNYLKWGQALSEDKDYAQAVEKLEIVINEYPQSDSFDEAYQTAAQAHYDLSGSLKSSQDYQGAYDHLQLILDKYNQSKLAATAKGDLPALMITWGDSLRDDKQFLKAIEKFQSIAEITKDEKFIAQAEEKTQLVVAELARDSGADGQVVIEQARLYACGGEKVTDPSVDIFPEEPGMAMPCDDGYSMSFVPFEVLADIPGTFRYVISAENANRRVQSCDYVTSYDRRTLERWQYGTKVTITEVKSGKVFKGKTFYGTSPESCPSQYWFSGFTEETWGDYVDESKINEWLVEVLK
jgi:tetratricopeptide (TPR) repeat protein